MEEKLLALMWSLLILGQATALRAWAGTWLVPGCIFGLFWFLYTFIPIIALWSVPMYSGGVLYILLACISFSLGGLLFPWRVGFKRKAEVGKNVDLGSPFMFKVFYFISVATVFSFIIDMGIQGATLLRAVTSPMEVAADMIGKRYTDSLVPNVFAQVSIVFQYPSAILGGFLYTTRKPGARRWPILVMAFIPPVLAMILQGAKGNIFLVLVLFWAATLICRINQGDRRLFSRKDIKRAMWIGAMLFGLVTIGFVARGLDNYGTDTVSSLQRLFASYAAAHMYAFSDWFHHLFSNNVGDTYTDNNLGGYGIYTFTMFARLMGNKTALPPGVYEEYFVYKEVLQTNIYTMFRGMINDFGLEGSIFVMLVAGILLHLSFWLFLVSRRPALTLSIYVHSIGFFYTSFIISLMIWNSIYASVLLVAGICFMNNWHAVPSENSSTAGLQDDVHHEVEATPQASKLRQAA
ncbi:O-antigen polymerase [Cupriavidus sp. 2SB]|uniref:O-antigen polymerase n=1 Tax=Cupriavidus sp. 2SB TaxID=2502199 RepID=UPI0010F6A612|nr:O-antigen polymerase [Cupriavidus sp. 2SB]